MPVLSAAPLPRLTAWRRTWTPGNCAAWSKISRNWGPLPSSTRRMAGILKAPRSKVSEWLSLYQKHGVDGLLEGYRSGRPSSLTAEQRAQLGDILESGPVAY